MKYDAATHKYAVVQNGFALYGVGETDMTGMTDSKAADVLAAHNEWRRFRGETGVPGAPVMGCPTETGLAIDHAIARLREPAGVGAVRYDAGLLSDFGGGNVEWWQDYIRAELERAHDFYTEALAQQPAAVDGVRERLVECRDWFDQQADTISKGGGSTWDLLQCREQRDLCDAALAAQHQEPTT